MLTKDGIAQVLHGLNDTPPDDIIAGCGVYVAQVLSNDDGDDELALDVVDHLRRMAAAIEGCLP